MSEDRDPSAGPRPHRPRPPERRRREPLPQQLPSAPPGDPEAPERVRRLLDSPAYRRADRDLDLLQRDAVRRGRLMLDYLKAELDLEAQGIESTIVVFGGTRIVEPAVAEGRLEEARRALEESPGEAAIERKLAVAERVQAKSRYYDVARTSHGSSAAAAKSTAVAGSSS